MCQSATATKHDLLGGGDVVTGHEWGCCGTHPDDSKEEVEVFRAELEILGTFATRPSPTLCGSATSAKVLQLVGSAIGGRPQHG
jgi:hypothetical protein